MHKGKVMSKRLVRTVVAASALIAVTAQANMSITFHDKTQISDATLNGIAAGINGMGAYTPLNNNTFSVQPAPDGHTPVNTVINADFFKPGFVPVTGNAIIGWDAASKQFNYGWGDNTAYKVGRLCMNIAVDNRSLPEACTNNSKRGVMMNAPVNYNAKSTVVVTFSRG